MKIEKTGDRKNSKFEIEENQFFDVNSDDGAVWLKGKIDRESLVNPETGEAKINLKVGSVFLFYRGWQYVRSVCSFCEIILNSGLRKRSQRIWCYWSFDNRNLCFWYKWQWSKIWSRIICWTSCRTFPTRYATSSTDFFDKSVEHLRITDRTIISIMITVSYEIYHVII